VNGCFGCASEDIGDDWSEFDVTIAPGSRGGGHWSEVHTRIVVTMCPACLVLPESVAFRAMIEAPFQAPMTPRTRCVIMCVHPSRRRWLSVLEGPKRCPSCARRADVEDLAEAPNRLRRIADQWRQGASRGRELSVQLGRRSARVAVADAGPDMEDE
jgi:hypothetical protein